ncbi:MAG: hypothetical protein L0191_19960 [Acidobacteria bacterium]|nr:hypothetical protein [Acidobacteriota bacterium]
MTLTLKARTAQEAQKILDDPCLHKTVHEVLAIAAQKDAVDAIYDLRLALEILIARYNA